MANKKNEVNHDEIEEVKLEDLNIDEDVVVEEKGGKFKSFFKKAGKWVIGGTVAILSFAAGVIAYRLLGGNDDDDDDDNAEDSQEEKTEE